MTSLLHVITDTDRRGAQVFGQSLCRRLDERGRPGRLVALAPGRSGRPLDAPTLGTTRLGSRTLLHLRREMSGTAAVVAHGSSTLAACALAGAGAGIPFVYRNIGDPLYWADTPLRQARVRLLLARAAGVVALWPGARRALIDAFGVPEHKIVVIPNGVEATGFSRADTAARLAARRRFRLDPDCPVLLYLGALSAEKDVGLAIEAMAALPECQLLIVGEGPARDPLQAQAASVAPDRIRFTGAVEDPGAPLASADAIVLCSRSEGMPGVLIEAAFSGVPAVATAVGAVGEIVVDEKTGRLFSLGDATGFAAAVRDVLDHKNVYGEAARSRCLARFELNVVADAWDALFQRMERRTHARTEVAR